MGTGSPSIRVKVHAYLGMKVFARIEVRRLEICSQSRSYVSPAWLIFLKQNVPVLSVRRREFFEPLI
jgi:hypothetical protein